MHTSKFTAFMVLKVVVCIGSDSVENVFSISLVGLGGRRGPGDVLCMGNGGMLSGQERIRCRKVVLLSLSVDGAMVRLPVVC